LFHPDGGGDMFLETSVLVNSTQRHIPGDGILQIRYVGTYPPFVMTLPENSKNYKPHRIFKIEIFTVVTKNNNK
jgi:hypothetical protein